MSGAAGPGALRAYWPALGVAVAGASAVVLGALGAHGLRAELSAPMLGVWHTAVRFQFWHTLALAVAAFPARHLRAGRIAAALLALGIVLFCGSLYALALGAPQAVGFITPFGGIALIAGWIALGVALWRAARRQAG